MLFKQCSNDIQKVKSDKDLSRSNYIEEITI